MKGYCFLKKVGAIVLIIFFFVGCSQKTSENKDPKGTKEEKPATALPVHASHRKSINTASPEFIEVYNNVTLLLQTLPSPEETAKQLEQISPFLQPQLLNPLYKTQEMISTKEMAINLGVYIADACYISMYNSEQRLIEYLESIEKLSKKLSIYPLIDKGFIKRLESNIVHKDSVIRLLSNAFLEYESKLLEGNQLELLSYVMFGGWVEGLYLAANIAQISRNKEFIRSIEKQDLTFDIIMEFLSRYVDPDDSSDLLDGMQQCKDLHLSANLAPSEEKLVLYSEFFAKVTELRNRYTNNGF